MTQQSRPERQMPERQEHLTIGALLLQARIDLKLTSREVCDLTRLTPETLRRVEAGQFEQCGGDVYARGHIRAYAQAVGLEPEPLLELYGTVHLPPLTKRDLRKPRTANPSAPRSENPLGLPRKDARQAAANRARAVLPTIVPGAVPSLVPMAGATPPPDLPALKQPRRNDYTDADSGSAARLVDPVLADGAAVNEVPATFLGGSKAAKAAKGAKPNWSLALLGAVGAVGMVAAVQLWPHSASANTRAASSTATERPHAAAQASARPAAPPPPSPSAAPKAPVDLKITAKAQPVWIGVVNSAGQQLFGNMLAPGQTMEFTDSTRLDVTTADAAGVTLQLNGKDLAAAGAEGQVTASFGPNGPL